MHHAAAEYLQPILALAEADLAAFARTLNVDFHRRFGEGEKARAEAHLHVGDFEKGLAEFFQDPFQMAEIGLSSMTRPST